MKIEITNDTSIDDVDVTFTNSLFGKTLKIVVTQKSKKKEKLISSKDLELIEELNEVQNVN
ncbi:hypothetical protein [Leeuwenhoekiella marinoflava]|uniref:hypothetical protein n=1 Tax=Leeuwenhoekiella marinoflava TaxID=988 RepID=UPI0030034FA9